MEIYKHYKSGGTFKREPVNQHTTEHGAWLERLWEKTDDARPTENREKIWILAPYTHSLAMKTVASLWTSGLLTKM